MVFRWMNLNRASEDRLVRSDRAWAKATEMDWKSSGDEDAERAHWVRDIAVRTDLDRSTGVDLPGDESCQSDKSRRPILWHSRHRFDGSSIDMRISEPTMARLKPIAWATTLALSISCSSGVCETTQAGTARTERRDFDVRVMSNLAGWAARLSGRELPQDYAVPIARRLAPGELGRRVCPEHPEDCRQVAAAYDIRRREIIYHHALDPRIPLDRSYLVHELVHSLQHREAGEMLNVSCETILGNEQQAYTAQALYLRLHGSNHPVGLELASRKCPPDGTNAG